MHKWLIAMLFAACLLGSALPVFAGDTDPLFINMTTDDAHRANMAISFGKNQLERGHALTIFLNDKGVLVGSTVNVEKFSEHQKMLTELIAKGATIYMCPMCMKHYGIDPATLLPGIQVSNPELTGGALFKDGTQTLSW